MVDLINIVFIFMSCVSCIYNFDSYYDNAFDISTNGVSNEETQMPLDPLMSYLYWCWENSFFSKVLMTGVKMFEIVFLLYVFRGVLMVIFDVLEQPLHQLQQQQWQGW